MVKTSSKKMTKKQKRSLRRDSPNINKDITEYKGGKLNVDEICHNCTPGAYASAARRFCKLHDKVWKPKSNSCRKKKTKKQNGGKSKTKKENNLKPEDLEYFNSQPYHRRKRLLKDPCFPSTESPECVKLMVKDNPWMLEEGGDKYAQGVVGKKSPLIKEIKANKKAGGAADKKTDKKADKTNKSKINKSKINKSKINKSKINKSKINKSKITKYDKYDKCLEECELKKNKKHVCSLKCKKYKNKNKNKNNEDNFKKIKSNSNQSKKQGQTGGCVPCAAPIIPSLLTGLTGLGVGVASLKSNFIGGS